MSSDSRFLKHSQAIPSSHELPVDLSPRTAPGEVLEWDHVLGGKENSRLKRLVADLSLDNAILKEAASRDF